MARQTTAGKLAGMMYTDLTSMNRQELTSLLQSVRSVTKRRIETIEKHAFESFVPNIEKLKESPRITKATTKKDLIKEISRKRTFILSDRGTFKTIHQSLTTAYQRAQSHTSKLGGSMSPSASTEFLDPKLIKAEKFTDSKGRTKTRYLYTTETGRQVEVKKRYLITGKEVFVNQGVEDPALMTLRELRTAYNAFHRIEDDPAIKASGLDSDRLRLLVFYVRQGKIYVNGRKTHDIAQAIVDVYDSYMKGTKDKELADEAVYNALDSLK